MIENGVHDVLDVVRQSEVMFTHAAIGMALVDVDGRFLRVNPALCELVGRSESELLETHWQSITHPDDVPPGERELTKAISRAGRTFRLAKRYVHSDGHLIWVLLSVSLIRSHLGEPVCLFTQVVDVSEQRKAEQELFRLASIVESSDDAILSKTLDGTILTWNDAASRMYGYSASEVVGRSILTIVPPDRADEVMALIDRVGQGESVRNVETVRVCKDGSLVDVSVTASPIRDPNGAIVRASTIDRDITEQKRVASELEATLVALQDALEKTQAAEARSRRFLTDAAHHLRNPIAGIQACGETLLRGQALPEQTSFLVQIGRQTSQVSRLIDRLLRMTRLEQGEGLLIERCDLVEICEAEVERAKSLAPELDVRLTADGPREVLLDELAVREILASLLDNARRHATRRIDVAVNGESGLTAVRVTDDGPGLAEGTVDQAFEPFVSLDGRGFGLGLTVARALARAHDGDIFYEDGGFTLRMKTSSETA